MTMARARCFGGIMATASFLLFPNMGAGAAPGDRFVLSPADLPTANSTVPTDFDPTFADRPEAAMPQVPPGFAISLFASGLKHPRSLAVTPEGDIFVVEEGPGVILRLRDTDGDGKADQSKEFSAGFDR